MRAVIKGEIDPLAAVLLIAGPFVKPSTLGGVARRRDRAYVALHRPGWWRGLAGGAAAFARLAAICHVASGGAWLSNITSSTGQPLTLTR